MRSPRLLGLWISLLSCVPLFGQTVTVTTAADDLDIDFFTGTVADLPGPDGVISFREAIVATNNTAGHQTIEFAIPQSEWILQFIYPGRAVIQSGNLRVFDALTIDGTSQTAFTGDTNPEGHEVALYGSTLYLNGDNCTLWGFDSAPVSVTGSNALVEGNTGSMNIDVFGGSGSTIRGNSASVIKIDRSSDNLVVGNVTSRVRVLGGGPAAVNNRIGGPNPADRNIIWGYGTYNSEGLPSGSTVQLFDSVGTVIENNWIGTMDGLTVGNVASTEGILLLTQNSDVTIKDNLISGIIGLGNGPHHAGQLFGRGILASGSGDGLTITGNVLGLDINGAPTLGAVTGLDLGVPVTHQFSMTNVVVGGLLPGEGNVIAGNVGTGILVGPNTNGVRISGNSIYDNGNLGIDLLTPAYAYGVTPNDALDADFGANGLQNFPVVDTVLRVGADLRVTGTLNSMANQSFTVEFFASSACDPSGNGEGEVFLGSTMVVTDAAGDASFDVVVSGPVTAGWFVSATATRENSGETSEFSACVGTGWTDLGGGTTGMNGTPQLTAASLLQPGSPLSLALENAPPASPVQLWVSLTSTPVSALGGTLYPVPAIGRFILVTDGSGSVNLNAAWPTDFPAGNDMYLQYLVSDASVGSGLTLSNGLQASP